MDRLAVLRSVTDALPMPAVIIGRSARILTMNGAAERLVGARGVARHYTSVFRQPGVTAAIERALETGRASNARYLGKSIASDEVYRAKVAPLSGTPSPGVLCIFEDQTREEGLGQMRRDFVANVSHELRSPLTALSGFIETLRGPAAEDAKAHAQFLQMMDTETGRMMRLVQDLLSLSRVESEERITPEDRVDLCAILRDVVQVMETESAQSNVTITTELPEGPAWIAADEDQMVQVFRNLIENAIKYGHSKVYLRLKLPEREAFVRGPAVVVDVMDDGAGIEPEHLPRLTERFFRVDSHRSRAQGGTGLGLAIVKHVVGRHRGRLSIASVPGQGSTFSVILPRL